MTTNDATVAGSASERLAALAAGFLILATVLFLLVRNQPITDPALFLALRLLLSLCAAILGATLPGFLRLDWKGKGFAIRAGGALALFVLSYVYTPALPGAAPQVVNQSSTGDGSPPLYNNSGTVTVNMPTQSTQGEKPGSEP
ncbi:hypothetical protein CHU95_12025 [Niveispirillum lacus]|uniref:Uncharacterized protein n=1 Tax=Niveispirillum lacus TaxID=1981099 RepID=A0A255Z0I2_9PROT|nr:hypothetical protein [Niveispirillum lacus]OYQ34180.1 hypothetical protein CHU95_12025 [Niveispirillum lacus]